jgi:hypothetical protein
MGREWKEDGGGYRSEGTGERWGGEERGGN